jgi:L-gulonate 3-dehydrogenase
MRDVPDMAGRAVIAETIAIVGAGSIGVAWAVVFVTGGYSVTLQDPDAGRLVQARQEVFGRIEQLECRGLLQNSTLGSLHCEGELRSAIKNATYIQECAPENLRLKQDLFAALAACADPNAIFASSSSAIPVSAIAGDKAFRDRCLIVHPLNPPYLLRVVEIVAASFTSDLAVRRAESLLTAVNMMPIVVGREIEGFLFNRLQGALLREAYCLVRDGIASVEQVDTAIRDGLGLRWSVLGVFETVDLNTRGGIAAHAEKLGPAYARMGADRGQNDPWTPDLVTKVASERRAQLPLDRWEDRVRWRDERLLDLAQLRNNHAGWRSSDASGGKGRLLRDKP